MVAKGKDGGGELVSGAVTHTDACIQPGQPTSACSAQCCAAAWLGRVWKQTRVCVAEVPSLFA